MTRRRKRGLSSIDRHSLRVSASTFSAAIRSAPELSLAGASSHRPRRYPAGTADGQPVLMMVLSYVGCARRDGPVRAGQAQAGCAARISAIPVCSPAASSEKRLAGRRIRRQQGGGSGLSERLSLHIYMPFYLWKRRWVMSTAATLSATCACMRAPSCRVAWKVTDTVRQRA